MAAPAPSSTSGRALRARQRRALHRKRELLLQQALVTVLGAAAEERKGTRTGTKTIPRKRADLDGIMRGLGGAGAGAAAGAAAARAAVARRVPCPMLVENEAKHRQVRSINKSASSDNMPSSSL